jgi:SAM-dependent methyltransferase
VIIEASDPSASPWADWLQTAAGRYLQAWESARLDEAVGDVFGFHAVQLGFPQLDTLSNSRIRDRIMAVGAEDHRWSAATAQMTSSSGRSIVVLERFDELPFGEHTVDLVVLPHLLEFSPAPHRILRDINRVLRPEGRIVVTGFNPISLWGVRESVAALADRTFLPARGQWIGVPRLRDWFELLGFEIGQISYGCYRPACRTELWLDRMRFMERAGDRWWPICGAAYMVSAVKRVQGMRLMGKAWKRKRVRTRRVVATAPQFTPPPARRQRGA